MNIDSTLITDQVCLHNILGCERVFASHPYLRRLPELITPVRNYTGLISQLSSCLTNVIFIHSRHEMHKIVKPKLPHVESTYRSICLCLRFNDTVQNQPMTCITQGARFIEPVRQYLEHGLHARWADLASILMFNWNTGVKQNVDEEYKIFASKLDDKLVSTFLSCLERMLLQ